MSDTRWFQRLQAGLCGACGKRPPEESKTCCAECNKSKRATARTQYSPEERAIKHRRLWDQLVNQVLDAYGGKCSRCGETDRDVLVVDHINGGGNEHRREIGEGNLYRWLRRNGFPSGFTILCANDHLRKHRRSARRV